MDMLSALSPLQANYGLPGGGGLSGLSGLGMASSRVLGLGGLDPASGQMMELFAMQNNMLQMLTMLMVGQAAKNPQALANLAQGLQGISERGGSPPGTGGAGGASGAASGGGVSQASEQPKDQGEIDQFIQEAASAYGADPKVLREIARRESNFKADAVNNWDSNAKKGTPSKGMFQFIEPTFKSMAPKAKAANPKAWEGMGEFNWQDWRQQALVAAWAIANGQGSHWATYKAAGGK